MDNSLNLYLEKDGYYFDSIFHYKGALLNKDAIYIFENNISKYIDYINENQIEKVILDLNKCKIESLQFLLNIPNIKYLKIIGDCVDFNPLYQLKQLKLLTITGSNDIHIYRIEGLESFSTLYPNNVKGLDMAKSLKSLKLVDGYNTSNLHNLYFLSNLEKLDTLFLGNLNITTLEGLENLKNLKVLILENMKKLESINQLSGIKNKLKNLRIENCNKIQDFNSIKYLSELVFLSISRVKLVPNIEFIKCLKKLSTFVSDGSNVIDGNLTSLINLNHVVVYPIRKHYYIEKQNENRKAKETDFKYGDRIMGDEDIELWRRIQY